MEQVLEKRENASLLKLKIRDVVVAMAIRRGLSGSEQLAKKWIALRRTGRAPMVFVIGGSLGLSPAVKKRADRKISFGHITLPHQLMRLY